MYATRVFNDRSRRIMTGEKVPFLAEKEKFQDRRAPVMPRHKGKQFMTNPPRKAGGADFGRFHKLKYGGEKYDDSNGYRKKQPHDKRLLGFGSHDAKRRDEFMMHIRTEQYRQQLRTEFRTTSKHAASAAPHVASGKEDGSARLAETTKPRVSMYDRVHSTEVAKRLGKRDERNLGTMTLSSRAIGLEAWKVSRPEFGAYAQTKDFYFKGHVADVLK